MSPADEDLPRLDRSATFTSTADVAGTRRPARILIHQIFYSPESRTLLDPEFFPLDNSDSSRPDWREYWPIRRFLLSQQMEENAYYGFFSPEFGQRTALTGRQVHEFITQRNEGPDGFLFSPFFGALASYSSVFTHGERFHPGMMSLARRLCATFDPPFDVDRLVSCSSNAAYCNYIVARPAFWRQWLEVCERLFAAAEDSSNPLAVSLNAPAKHHPATIQFKVLILERLIAVVIALNPQFKLARFPMEKQLFTANLGAEATERLLLADALKSRYVETGIKAYLQLATRSLSGRLVQKAALPPAEVAFNLAGAQRYAAENRTAEWVERHMKSGPYGNPRLRAAQQSGLKVVWSGPHRLPLEKAVRNFGPEPGMRFPSEPHEWEARVAAIQQSDPKPEDLPPLILVEMSGNYQITDGSHRHEALRRNGHEYCWALVWRVATDKGAPG